VHRRYRHPGGRCERTPVAIAAVTRKLVGIIWAALTGRETRT